MADITVQEEIKMAKIMGENANISKKAPFAVVEAYKNIRIRFLYILENMNAKVVAFSSPFLSEGKSTTAVNMAITLSQSNKKVILIDGDIRRPTVYKKLKIANDKGLSDILAREAKFEDAVVNYNPYLDVLTSGSVTVNPSDLLGSTDFDKLLEKLRKEYDYILIDTPPVNIVSDALAISKKCDGVVLIARVAATTYRELKAANNAMKSLDIKVLGTIINGAGVTKKRYGSYNKYGY